MSYTRIQVFKNDLNTFGENEQLRSLDVSNVRIIMIVYASGGA